MAPEPTHPSNWLLIVAISKRPAFLDPVGDALAALTTGSPRTLHADPGSAGAVGPPGHGYAAVLRRARRYLDTALPDADIHLVCAGSTAEAAQRAAAAADTASGAARRALALVLLDADGTDCAAAALDRSTDEALDALRAALPAGVEAEISPYTTLVYQAPGDDRIQVGRQYTLRHPPAEPWVLAADVICAFTDFVQMRYTNVVAGLAAGDGRRALARGLAGFLTDRAGPAWGLHYYTGSMVSGLIGDLESAARAGGNPVLRGPSEHSLACGALARWQLDGAPYLIVVTSGMVDEFRGVLTDLREARAPGFIVCGESQADRWFPFQGTVHAAEDSRAVLRARHIAAVYLSRPDRLEQDLAAAYAAFDAGSGPVVLLATPAVLDAVGEPPPVSPRPRRACAVATGEEFDAVVRLLNTEPATLLWQCGHLTAEESDLVHELAERTGAALADSLTHPGAVASYRDGRRVEAYLGTLGLYGYSARVYQYLHHGGRLRPREQQCLFFLKSRIPEIATPFSARTLTRALRIVQVTHDPAHRAPFADHAVIADLAPVLRAVRDRLDVRHDVLDLRRAAIRATADTPSDVVGQVPVSPMSLNYFYRKVGAVLHRLIRTDGYEYTGVFDVGRGGLSAVRNLPRTGPGFSGWYGRALMGNALQAIPTLAVTRPGNLLAFVGDGAAALVPDIVPSLVQQVCLGGNRFADTISIFRLVDGGHSLIRTYREARQGAEGGYQTALLGLVDDDWRRDFGPVQVVHRRLAEVDADALAAQLREPATINLYSVIIGHNNEGDGLSLLASLGWQRDELPALAFAGTGRNTATHRPGRPGDPETRHPS